jgi:hypothetical protein
MNYPFQKRKRPNPKRKEPRRVAGRTRLKGEDMTELRRKVFARSGGKCEEIKVLTNFKDWTAIEGQMCPPQTIMGPCGAPITWDSMELSHNAHGSRRDDSEAGTIASCKSCHTAKHNAHGVPRRPGKIMKIKDAQAYWNGLICFCDSAKKPRESFCPECSLKLSPQTALDLKNADDPDDYRQALANAETEILLHV